MGPELLTVLAVLGAALVMFVTDRVRLDVVALLVVVSLTLTGVLTPAQALAGFGDPLVVMVAALFVVSGAMVETGLAASVGRWIERVGGKGQARLTAVLMLATAALSAFMSSTGTVAVMLPVAVRLAWRQRFSPSRLLLPVAFAALMGGTLTIISTPPNLVASQALSGAGYGELGFFALAPVGLVMLVVTVAYTVTVGRRLTPDRAPDKPVADGGRAGDITELAERYGLADQLRRFVVTPRSPLAGSRLGDLRWPELHGVRVIAIDADPAVARRPSRPRHRPGVSKRIEPDTLLEVGDRVLVQGPPEGMAQLAEAHGLEPQPVIAGAGPVVPSNLVFAEVLVPPRSRWHERSLAELRFRDRYRLVVLAVQRGGQRLSGDLARVRLREGDVLLVRGFAPAVEALRREREDGVLLAEAVDGEPPAPRADRAPVAAAVVAAMLVAMAATSLPLVAVVLVAVLALVGTGCMSAEGAYRSVQWPSVVLLGGMLPLATALSETGGVDLLVGALTGALGGAGHVVVVGATFFLAVLLTQFLSNTAAAVLTAPVALQTAAALGVHPAPLLVAVALGASCALVNPVSTPVTSLVLGPGHYRFSDVPKVGLPLLALLTVVVLLVVPALFPL